MYLNDRECAWYGPQWRSRRNNAKHEFERPLCACCSNDDSNVYLFASHCNSLRWRSMATMLSVRFQWQKLALQRPIRYCWMGNGTCITANANHPFKSPWSHESWCEFYVIFQTHDFKSKSTWQCGKCQWVHKSLEKNGGMQGLDGLSIPLILQPKRLNVLEGTWPQYKINLWYHLNPRKGSAIGYCPNST